jgi:hypothetical protein
MFADRLLGIPKRALAVVAITLMLPLGAPYGPLERTSTTLVVVSLRLGTPIPWLGPRARQSCSVGLR